MKTNINSNFYYFSVTVKHEMKKTLEKSQRLAIVASSRQRLRLKLFEGVSVAESQTDTVTQTESFKTKTSRMGLSERRTLGVV